MLANFQNRDIFLNTGQRQSTLYLFTFFDQNRYKILSRRRTQTVYLSQIMMCGLATISPHVHKQQIQILYITIQIQKIQHNRSSHINITKQFIKFTIQNNRIEITIIKITITIAIQQKKMDKQKLIGMIIKKDLYKDTKPIQVEIHKKKQQAVNVSILAVYHILKDNYNAQAKLYAVRFLKDCFQKGNESFISKVQNKLLPILVQISIDSDNQNSILKYGGSYTKNSDLQKFKSLVLSLFKISRECIQKWASWVPDSHVGFAKAQKQVAKCKSNPWKDGFLYFREQNEEIFRQNCIKNGMKLSAPSKLKIQQVQKPQKKPEKIQKLSKHKSVNKINTIIRSIEDRLNNNDYLTDKQIGQLQSRLNASLNEYIEEVSEVDEKFLQVSMQKFQVLKRNNEKGIKSRSSKIEKSDITDKKSENKSEIKIQTPMPVQIPKQIQKSELKMEKQNLSDPTLQNLQNDKSKVSNNPITKPKPNSNIKQKQKNDQGLIKKQPFNEQPLKIQVIPPQYKQKQIQQKVQFVQSEDQQQSEIKSFAQKNNSVQNKMLTNNQKEQKSNIISNGNKISNNPKNDPIANNPNKDIKNQYHSNTNSNISKQIKLPTQKQSQRQSYQPSNTSNFESTAKFIRDEQFTGKKIQNKDSFEINHQTKSFSSALNQSQIRKPVPEHKIQNQSNQFNKKSNQSWNKIKSNPSVNNSYSTPNHNKNLPSEIQYLTRKYEKQTKQLYKKISKLQNEVTNLRENEEKTKINNKTWSEFNQVQNNFLKKQLEKQRKDKQSTIQQIQQLKSSLIKLKMQFNQSKDDLKNLGLIDEEHKSRRYQLSKKYERQTFKLTDKMQRLEKELMMIKQNEIKSKPRTWNENDFKYNQTGGNRNQNSISEQIYQIKKQLNKMKKQFQRSLNSADASMSNNTFTNMNQNDTFSQRNSRMTNKSSYRVKKLSPQKLTLNEQLFKDYLPEQKNTFAFEMPASTDVRSTRVDEDYINNMTNYQKIGSWLNQTNEQNFKLCILGVQQKFYEHESVVISRMQNLFTQNGINFLKMTFSFHFKRLQSNPPKVVYKNIAEIDFWTKNVQGNNEVYTQETIGRLCVSPIKIMKATVYFGENQTNSLTFLLPFLYINYLKPGQFDSSEFSQIIGQKHHQVTKSKVFQLNSQISHASLTGFFKKSCIVNQYLQICFQQSGERVFLTQIELLRNQKAVIRILPIPVQDSQMNMKAKELINNLVYLLS